MVTNDIKYILNTHVPTIFAALMLLLTACSDEQYENTRNPGQQTGGGASGPLITVTATQGTRPQTRLGYDVPDNNTLPITVTWAEGDKFYVGKDFSSFAGSNTYLSAATAYFSPFTLTEGAGSKSAIFTGNQPAEVADGDPLYAFYGDGAQCIAIEKGTLSFDYTKQLQSANDNKNHLSGADFMVATTTETGRQPVFAFTRLGAMMKFNITLPEDGLEVTKLTLTATDGSTPFSTATQWNKEATLASTSKTASASITLQLGHSGITLTDKTLTAYMMVAPTTLTAETSPIADRKLKLQVAATNGSVYTAILKGADIEQGMYYTVKAEPVILPEEMSFTIRVKAGQMGFSIPFSDNDFTPTDITVDWGDGNKVTVKKDTRMKEGDQFDHIYDNPDDYIVTISSSQMNDTQQQIPSFNWVNRDRRWYSQYSCYNKDKLIKMNTSILNTGETSFASCFDGCTNLTFLPQGLFDKNKQAEGFSSCFKGCTSLTSVPTMFSLTQKVTTFASCFNGCTNLAAVPEDLFRYNTLAENFASCFNGCTSLTSVPEDLFRYNTLAKSFASCFTSCHNLTSVPDKLFKGNKAATDFSSCFSYSNLQSVPQGLFDENTKAEDFEGCFYYCKKLTSVPERLFCNAKKGYTVKFSDCFHTCTSLESLPGAMFPTLGKFELCFYSCTGLKSLPEKLFHHKDNSGNYTPTGGDFNQCFKECTSLASLPEGLFVDKGSKNFSECFYHCYNLVLNKNIFLDKKRGDTPDTRFKNGSTLLTMNFENCFFLVGRDIGDLSKKSEAPELWMYKMNRETTTKGCFSGTQVNNITRGDGPFDKVHTDGSFSINY